MTSETWDWNISVSNPAHNILITIKNTEEAKFHCFVKTLVHLHSTAHIIINESHMVLSHDVFCPVMNTFHWAGSMNIQIALLSATVPPSLIKDLFSKFGISVYTVCQEKTA
jgi:CRISPR/Cas system-associated endonuclease/helicase Cas3